MILFFQMEIIDKIDIGIFIILIILNVIFFGKLTYRCAIYIGVVILLGFVFPLMSSSREVDRAVEANGGPFMDTFNLFYTFLTFPIYWIVLFIQILIISIQPLAKVKEEKNEDILDDGIDFK